MALPSILDKHKTSAVLWYVDESGNIRKFTSITALDEQAAKTIFSGLEGMIDRINDKGGIGGKHPVALVLFDEFHEAFAHYPKNVTPPTHQELFFPHVRGGESLQYPASVRVAFKTKH